MFKRILSAFLALGIFSASALMFVSCDSDDGGDSDGKDTKQSDVADKKDGDSEADVKDTDDKKSDDKKEDDGKSEEKSRYSKFDQRTEYDEKEAVKVEFSEGSVNIKGEGASADGTVVNITKAGTYVLSGTCKNGRVIVEVPESDKVQLVFNGLKLVCETSAPIYIKCADKTSITLADGTTNTIQDGGNYTDLNADEEPNACLFSKTDLTINGTGTLNVYANYNNGIVTKDDLKIISGTISVNAENHGIRGTDSVTIKDGEFNISCKNDGIKSTKEKEGKGYIYIEGGKFIIDCGDDALQAVSDVTLAGGTFNVEAGGDVVNCDGTQNIDGGTFVAD